jgi:hypothetical protein
MSRHTALKGIIKESYYDEYDDEGLDDHYPRDEEYDEDGEPIAVKQKDKKKKKQAKSKDTMIIQY